MRLTKALASEYEQLFATSQVRPERVAAIDVIVDRTVKNKARYEAVAARLGVPWYVVAAIHNLEAGQRFTAHLHNGDPLTARTVKEPPGRPKTGAPPFTWEQSAVDALEGKGLHKVGTWTLPVMLYEMERYNGFGYRKRHPEVLTPYLWSFTTAYTKGKFVKDGEFSPAAVSQQCGAVALLKRLADRRVIVLPGSNRPADDQEDEEMARFVKAAGQDAVFLTNGIHRRWVSSRAKLKELSTKLGVPEQIVEISADGLDDFILVGPPPPEKKK